MSIPLFDAHCDTLSRNYSPSHPYYGGGSLRRNSGHVDLERAHAAFGKYAQFFAVFGTWNSRDRCEGDSLYPKFREQYVLFRRTMEENAYLVSPCRTAEEAERANAAGKVAAFLSVEGAELLDCDLEKLRRAHGLGVRAVNLTWNFQNALSGSNLAGADRGLTPRGRDFVREMERLGMLVDVSHLSDPGFWDVAGLVQGPIVASHSNSRALYFHPRNLTDGQFTAIMEHQGVVGLNMAAQFLGDDPTLDDLVRVLERFLDLGGENTVALGGDWDGIEKAPAGVRDVTAWSLFYQRLKGLGYGQALLDKIFYKNWMRVVEQVCTM
ncbi:MAG TPA: membrane dipeptidase [Lachnospiraceae bacterium]|nr:membrane dipeptidase [Lachnospiraceae bacterium]